MGYQDRAQAFEAARPPETLPAPAERKWPLFKTFWVVAAFGSAIWAVIVIGILALL